MKKHRPKAKLKETPKCSWAPQFQEFLKIRQKIKDSFFRQMLKISAVYLDKQKRFFPKKILSGGAIQNNL